MISPLYLVMLSIIVASQLPELAIAAPETKTARYENPQAKLETVQKRKALTQDQLQALQQTIKQTELRLQQFNQQAQKYQQALGLAMAELSKQRRARNRLEQQLYALKAKILASATAIEAAQQALGEQQRALAEQLQRQYRRGQFSPLQLVLNDSSLADTARMLRYHQTIHTAGQQKIRDINQQEQALQQLKQRQVANQQDLSNHQAELLASIQQQNQLSENLDSEHKQAQLSAKQETQTAQALAQRAQQLEQLLQELIRAETKAELAASNNFSINKGKLPIPVVGKIRQTFNQHNADGQGRWRGIWIEPAPGKEYEVNTIAAGHVVFADWLLGYGLLTIVDHGDGFFSLYGHTQTLLREPGDWVEADTVVALVNPTHMRNQPIRGLYFELREQSKALDPQAWLSSR